MIENITARIGDFDGNIVADNISVSIMSGPPGDRSWHGTIDVQIPPDGYRLIAEDGREGRIVVQSMSGFFQGDGVFDRPERRESDPAKWPPCRSD